MEERTISQESVTSEDTGIPTREYVFSPKVVCIAGPPAAGKTHAAQRLVDELGYKLIRLDGINAAIAEKYNAPVDIVRNPDTYKDFRREFANVLRPLRYANLVVEGTRMSHPHIYQALLAKLSDLYSVYTILQPFYLNPPQEVRQERYLLRKIRYAKQNMKGQGTATSMKEVNKPFVDNHEPILPGFVESPDDESIIQWARQNEDAAHPGIAPHEREVFKAIAEAESYNPFYQTIEFGGRVLVNGFTNSSKTWDNILKLNVDFTGKTLCDYGCMHGYYTFKCEEAGATGVGVDMDEGAVNLSNFLSDKKESQCHFMVYDITKPLEQKYDIILALNVLHRTGKFEQTTANMFQHCNECILEVGESQLPVIIGEGTRQGFKLKRNIPSHRTNSCIGPRRVIHMKKEG